MSTQEKMKLEQILFQDTQNNSKI